MQRLKHIQLTMFAFLVLGSVFASAALALPEITGPSFPASYTGKNTVANPTLETTKSESISCKEETTEGLMETSTLGTFHLHFSGCKSSGFSCNTSGDESGIILALGTLHSVFDSLSPVGVGMLYLPEEQTIKCTALVTLKIKGTVLCSVSEPLTSSATHELQCEETSGKPSNTSWWNDEGVEQHAKLETSKNGGTFIESAMRQQTTITFGISIVWRW